MAMSVQIYGGNCNAQGNSNPLFGKTVREFEQCILQGMDPPIRPSPRMSFSSDGALRGDSPDGLVEQQLLEEAQEKSKQEFTRFSLSDIADNPELAKAAKLELTGKKSEEDASSMVESMCEVASRITDLERVRFTAGSADRDAEREGQAGSEEVSILLKRLEVGKRYVSPSSHQDGKAHPWFVFTCV